MEAQKAHPRPRVGKTQKDRESGATARRLDNRSTRVEWEQEAQGKRSKVPFPQQVCNGKKNRYQVTGKNGNTIFAGGK